MSKRSYRNNSFSRTPRLMIDSLVSFLFERITLALTILSLAILTSGCNLQGSLEDLSNLLRSNVAVELSSQEKRVTNAQEIPVQVSFNTAVLDIVTKDFFQVVGASIKDDLVSEIVPGRVFSFVLVPTIQNGTVSVRFPQQEVVVISTDEKQERVPKTTSSSSLTFVIDQEKPVVALSTTETSPTKSLSIPINIVFSEPVTGLTSDDFTLTSTLGAVGGITGFSGSGTLYSLTLTPVSTGLFEIELPLGVVKDAAGNGNQASNKISVFYDSTIPVPVISSSVVSPTNLSTVAMTIDFGSVAVTGVSLSDFSLSAGTLSNLAGSGSTYTFTLQTPAVDGTVTLQLPAGSVENSLGSQNFASNVFSLVIDRASLGNPVPQLAVGPPTPSSGNKNSSFVWSIDYTGASNVTLAKEDITFAGSATAGCDASVTSSGSSRLVTVTGCTGDGTVRIQVAAGTATDSGGYLAAAHVSAAAVTVDNTGPTFSLTGPTPVIGNRNSTFRWTVAYAADALDIDLLSEDIVLTGTATADCEVSVSSAGLSYYVDVTGCSAEGSLGVGVVAATAKDIHGNLSLAATSSHQATVKNLGPGLTISEPNPTLGNSSTSFTWDLIYSSAKNIFLNTSTISTYLELVGADTDCEIAVSTPEEGTRTVAVSGCSGDGLLGLKVKAGSAEDVVGNLSVVATGSNVSVDNTGPGVSIGAASLLTGNRNTTFEWTISYTDAANILLTADHVTLSGATAGCVKTLSGNDLLQRKISVTGCTGDGSLSIAVAAQTATDSLGNLALAPSSPTAVTIDNTAPTLTIAEPVYAEGYLTDKLIWEVTYNDASEVLLDVADILPQGDSVGCVFGIEGAGTAKRLVTALGCSGHSSVGIQIAAGSAQDSVGNLSSASALSQTVKLLNPVQVNFVNVTQALNKVSAPGTQTIPIALEKALPVDVNVRYRVLSQTTATNPVDFDLPSSGSVVVPAGQTTADISFTYQGTSGSKIIQVALEAGISQVYNLSTSQGIHRRIIRDNGVKDFDYTKISSGNFHSCGLTSAGAIRCWGSNNTGALGNGTNISSSSPVAISGGGTFQSVSAGGGGTCAITTGGSLRCWGSAVTLGNGSTTASNIPVTVGAGYSEVSVGSVHVCAVTTAGAVQCWGQSKGGSVGPSDTFYYSPRTIASSGYQSVTAGGAFFSCALTTAGGIHCWGYNGPGHLGNGSEADSATPVVVAASGYKSISSGHQHTCAVTTSGGIRCWGSNGMGRLGNGTATDSRVPLTIASSGYESVSAGASHTCAITTGTKELRCWGSNSYGQVGTATSAIVPTAVGGSGYSQISSGQTHTCAIRTDGALRTTYCWGRTIMGLLANGYSLLPEREIPGGPYRQVSAGSQQTCAIKNDESLSCWGSGNSGLGNGSIPTFIGNGYQNVSIGGNFRCAITSSGGVRCWGSNQNGQLGNGTTEEASTPVAVATQGYKKVVTGDRHACALKEDGDLQCWGGNSSGQLGDGTKINSSVPVTVGSDYKDVSAFGAVTCAVTTSDILKCWGNNQMFQLANNSLTDSSSPITIGNYEKVSVGSWHVCAVNSSGALHCWGNNTMGQLGNNSTTHSHTPVVVASSGYTAVSAGAYHNCATATNGSLRCWGTNQHLQLGDSSIGNSLVPVIVRDSGYGPLVSSYNHTCAIRTDGRLFCWGDNTNNQLGDGNLHLVPTPIQPL